MKLIRKILDYWHHERRILRHVIRGMDLAAKHGKIELVRRLLVDGGIEWAKTSQERFAEMTEWVSERVKMSNGIINVDDFHAFFAGAIREQDPENRV